MNISNEKIYDKMRKLGEASSLMERIALETDFLHKLFFDDIVWTEEEEREGLDITSHGETAYHN